MFTEQVTIGVITDPRPCFRRHHHYITSTINSSFLAAGYIPPAAATGEVDIDGWDQFGDKYDFVYLSPGKGSTKIFVKCLAMNDTLLVDVFKNGDQELVHLEINVHNFIESGKVCYGTVFKDFGKLVSIINKEILGKLSATSESSLGTAKSRSISGITNRISRMSWADLPVDILFVIFGFLYDMNNYTFVDLYQCLAVCRPWRFVAKQIWQTRILPTTPWLLFHIDGSKKIFLKKNLSKCHEYPPSLATKDNNAGFSCNLTLFQLQTYASYDGWLLIGDSVF
ncbi:uncharacterized protein LOC141672225 isoform X2 [Apium graveolens]|uniref:uncharacterized protein LOC141672225 isoform X2 n=1 Tax=Apium graveolens TaxID=4045 RepID=UPI003D7AFB29